MSALKYWLDCAKRPAHHDAGISAGGDADDRLHHFHAAAHRRRFGRRLLAGKARHFSPEQTKYVNNFLTCFALRNLALLARSDKLPRCEFDTVHFCAMKKLDPRITRTRQALADSLIALALERGYEDLTIRIVTEHAGVGNRTFYRHFLSLDDLLKQILRFAFQQLKERALEAVTPHGEVRIFYTFVKDNQDLLRVYVSLPWDHPARQVVLTEAVKIVYERYSWQRQTSVPMGLSIEHILLATNNLVAWYLDHIDEYTPEQVAVIHDVLVLETLERQAIALREDWMQTRQKLV